MPVCLFCDTIRSLAVDDGLVLVQSLLLSGKLTNPFHLVFDHVDNDDDDDDDDAALIIPGL